MSTHIGVQFVYEDVYEDVYKDVYKDEQNTETGSPKVESKDTLTPDALAALPGEWLDTLKQGAHRADFLLISRMIEQIREQDATLADALALLADDFEYDEILKLLT